MVSMCCRGAGRSFCGGSFIIERRSGGSNGFIGLSEVLAFYRSAKRRSCGKSLQRQPCFAINPKIGTKIVCKKGIRVLEMNTEDENYLPYNSYNLLEPVLGQCFTGQPSLR
jgi:hypothetical protein